MICSKKIENTNRNTEAKMKTSKDNVEGKPSSELLNSSNVKMRDACLALAPLTFFIDNLIFKSAKWS